MSTPVIYAAVNQTPTCTALVIADWEDTLNALDNCYTCNKPRHVKRDCPEQTNAQPSYNRGTKRDFGCYNCDKKGHLARDCRGPKRNKGKRIYPEPGEGAEDDPVYDGTMQHKISGFFK